MTENPDLIPFWCETGETSEIPDNLKELGFTPTNPNIDGLVYNKMFQEIFSYLNHIKKKTFSFYDIEEDYLFNAEGSEFVRKNNIIYFSIKESLAIDPKNPETNPDYWTVFLDLDKPIYEQLKDYALKNGNELNLFKVKAAESSKDAVNLEQLTNLLSNVGFPIGFETFEAEARANQLYNLGGEFNRADHPSLWLFIKVSPLLKTETEWQIENTANVSIANPNGMCGYFSSGDGSLTFRLKNLEGATLKAVNGVDRIAGSFELDQNLAHTHNIPPVVSNNGAYSGNWYSANSTSNSKATSSSGGDENTVKNIGVLPLIVSS